MSKLGKWMFVLLWSWTKSST